MFLAFSFWLVDAYGMLGASTRQKLCSNGLSDCATYRLDPEAKRLVDNFPQAFSHLALVNSAWILDRCQSQLSSAS
jgi:hypothetical protein